MFEEFFVSYGVPVLGGAVFFCVAWIIARWSARAIDHLLGAKSNIDRSVVTLLARVVSIAILVLAGIAVLQELGVEVASLIAALGIFGFAIAIGMRTTTTNFFTGVMVLILKPYKVGEYIEGERVEGYVESISLFHTVVVTDDGVYVAVPNGPMWARSVRNFSRTRPRRVVVELVLERAVALDMVRSVIDKVLNENTVYRKDIPPTVRVTDVTEKNLDVELGFWGESERIWDLRTGIAARLKQTLTEAGIHVIRAGPRRRKRAAAKPKSPPPPLIDEEL